MLNTAQRGSDTRQVALSAIRTSAFGRFRLPRIVLWTILFLGTAFTVTPGVWMVLSSLKTRAEITAMPMHFFPEVPMWGNYVQAIQWTMFYRVFSNSLIITGTITLVNIISCTWGGYTFGKLRWPGRDVVFILVLSTLMIPGFLTLIPRYVIVSKIGMLDSFGGMILPFLTGPFGIFLTKQYLLGIHDELIDSAKVDGASALDIYWHLIFPLCKPVLSVIAIIVFTWSWDDLLWAVLILHDRYLWTLAVAIANLRLQSSDQYELQMAGSTLAAIPVIVVFLFFQKHIIQGVAFSGMKG